jgi:hypothetical protein
MRSTRRVEGNHAQRTSIDSVLGPISHESDAGLISENITKTPSILQIITLYILDF